MSESEKPGVIRLGLFDVVTAISSAVDMVSPLVNQHHRQVAMIAYAIGKEAGLPQDRLLELSIAASLHDTGGLTLAERLSGLSFEVEHPEKHTEYGYRLLKSFGPFDKLATFVRYHHHYFTDPRFPDPTGTIPLESRIIHLADRVAVYIQPRRYILDQSSGIVAHVRRYARFMFDPEVVWMFERIAARDSFWLNLDAGRLENHMHEEFARFDVELNSEQMMGLARLFTRIIDFRSPFTAAHSTGVAFVAEALARRNGFSYDDGHMMRLAGYLHDLGKLAVPAEILDKPGPLSASERRLIKRHAYYTDRVLKKLPALHQSREWGALHHERLNGSGYPFKLAEDEIPTGARIMAIADTFTALSEDRPYREGQDLMTVAKTLKTMADRRLLDADIVVAMLDNLREMEETRLISQHYARQEYEEFIDLDSEW